MVGKGGWLDGGGLVMHDAFIMSLPGVSFFCSLFIRFLVSSSFSFWSYLRLFPCNSNKLMFRTRIITLNLV